jgi:hypothetical protein
MKKNMGILDRILRAIVAAILLFLSYFGIISGVAAFVATGIGIILLGTSLLQFCPLYVPFNFSTRNNK